MWIYDLKKKEMCDEDLLEFSAELKNEKILIVGDNTFDTTISLANRNQDKYWAVWCGNQSNQWEETLGSNVFKADKEGMEHLTKILEYQDRKIRLYKRILKKPLPKEFQIGFVFDNVPKTFLDELFSTQTCGNALVIITSRNTEQLPNLTFDYMFVLNHSKKIWTELYNMFIPFPSYESFLKLLNCSHKDKELVLKFCKSETLFELYNAANIENVKLSPISWNNLDNVVPCVSDKLCQQLNDRLDIITRELLITQNLVKSLQDIRN
jgi:hypothetical protein